jgi:hypothetical protein
MTTNYDHSAGVAFHQKVDAKVAFWDWLGQARMRQPFARCGQLALSRPLVLVVPLRREVFDGEPAGRGSCECP